MTRSYEGRLCRLVPLSERHLPSLARQLQDTEVTRYLRLRTPASVEAQTARLRAASDSGSEVSFAVIARKDVGECKEGCFLGLVGLVSVDDVDKTAQGRVIIGEKRVWGFGVGTEARLLQLKDAFDHMELRWVWGSVFAPNVASRKLLEKTGYRQLGTRPASHLVEGEYVDELLYGANREQWERCWNNYEVVSL